MISRNKSLERVDDWRAYCFGEYVRGMFLKKKKKGKNQRNGPDFGKLGIT